MKKLIFTLILALTLSIAVLGGVHNPFAQNMHAMNGMIMMDHDMTSSDCNAQRCFMTSDNEHMQASFPSQPDFEKLLLTAVLGMILVVLTAAIAPRRFKKQNKHRLTPLAIDIGSVIFRE